MRKKLFMVQGLRSVAKVGRRDGGEQAKLTIHIRLVHR